MNRPSESGSSTGSEQARMGGPGPASREAEQERHREVSGGNVSVRQGGVRSVKAENMTVRQGGVLQADAQHLEMLQGGVGFARTETANLTSSRAGAMIARGDVRMDQSGAQLLVVGGDTTMDQAGAVVMVARNVSTQNSGVVFLLAQQVEGDVRPAFGPRESAFFGAAAGLALALVMLVARMVRQRQGGWMRAMQSPRRMPTRGGRGQGFWHSLQTMGERAGWARMAKR